MLETERLTLRTLTLDDAEPLYRIYHEPDVLRYFVHGPPESIAIESASLQRHLLHYAQHGFGLYATVLRETGELIGRCGLLAQQVDGTPEVELAYLLSPRFWGLGLASEAARAIRDFAFHTFDLPRLVSLIHPQNLASKHVATATGMTFSRTTHLYGIEVEVHSIARPPHEKSQASLPPPLSRTALRTNSSGPAVD